LNIDLNETNQPKKERKRSESWPKKKRLPPPPRPDRPLLITPQRSFLNLLDLLKERKVVAVDEAAKIVGASTKEIEDYTQRYPKHFLWFGGPIPTIALAVAPEKPDGGTGAQEIPNLP
jgi:hypothetical protein